MPATPSADTRAWPASGGPGTSHQGFPILDGVGHLVGVLTQRDLRDAPETTRLESLVRGPAVTIFDDCTLRQAADLMASERLGRIPVVTRSNPRVAIGILTRSDLVQAHVRRLREQSRPAF